VGCLKAAQMQDVEFAGYGGSSAGSIVALLAAVGYSPDELRSLMVDEIDFKNFLEDGGTDLAKLTKLPTNFQSKFEIGRYVWRNRSLLDRVHRDLGLYDAHKLEEFLEKKIKEKLPMLKHKSGITFHDLNQANCRPLKILVSDLRSHEPLVCSGAGPEDRSGLVLDAVAASMSYPFVFRPVQMNKAYHVDGGLTSNLPVFLFERERQEQGIPVLAFDLVSSKREDNQKNKFETFCHNLFTTALEATDVLLRQVLTGIHHIQVKVPDGIGTLDFALSREARTQLFNAGYVATSEYFSQEFKFYEAATSQTTRMQALHVPRTLVEPILEAMTKSFEAKTRAEKIRANIMLPTGDGTRKVVYQYGMDTDTDSDFELDLDAGCGGGAWTRGEPVAGNLLDAKRTFSAWGLTQEQQNRVRADRKAMLCFPIFELDKRLTTPEDVKDLDRIGVLSVDTSTPLGETDWLSLKGIPNKEVITAGRNWADIFSRILR